MTRILVAGSANGLGRLADAVDDSEGRRAAVALARVAHDLRAPLTVIGLATEVLLQAMSYDAAREDERMDVEVIRDAARGMQRLVGDLLDEAALASGRVTLRPTPVAPGTLVTDVVRLLGRRASEQDIRLVADVPELPPALIDRDRVLQVLANLIENAIDYSPPGAEIEVGVTSVAGGVSFSVRDSGRGIKPEDLPHVFEPFWRAPGGTRRGTGLGLSIARSIVEAHGGTISVRSAPGVGSTFAITLPAEGGLCQTAADTGRRL